MTRDFEPQDEYRRRCIECLMAQLSQRAPFREELKRVQTNFTEITQYSWYDIEPSVRGQQTTLDRCVDQLQLKAYMDNLKLIVNKFGLNPEWGLEQVHNEIRNSDSNLRIYMSHRKTHNQEYSIVWNPMGRSKSEAESSVFQEFKEQWAEYEAHMKGIGYKKHHSKPQLEEHISWVFRHVCLGEKWKDIAENARVTAQKKKVVTRNKKGATKEKMYNDEDVQKEALKIIRMLGLQLQKGGRPKKQP